MQRAAIMASASDCCSSEPRSLVKKKGTMPMTVVRDVMMMGRILIFPALCIASCGFIPFLTSTLMASSFKMLSLMTIPQDAIKPMPDMMFIMNLLAPLPTDGVWTAYQIVSLVLLVLMAICALVAIIIVLFQPGNSTGIDALGGSSETFFGKNKGRSMESKMKKWTTISLIVLGVLAVLFFILQFGTIWGVQG